MTIEFANPITEAQGWIADHLLDDEQRAYEESWETGTGDASWELDLDRGARIMQALLPFASAWRAVFAGTTFEMDADVTLDHQRHTVRLAFEAPVDLTGEEFTALALLVATSTPTTEETR